MAAGHEHTAGRAGRDAGRQTNAERWLRGSSGGIIVAASCRRTADCFSGGDVKSASGRGQPLAALPTDGLDCEIHARTAARPHVIDTFDRAKQHRG